MTKIIAYVRVSSDKQDADSQELEIRRYADEKKMTISEVLSIQVSSRKLPLQRRIDEMLEKLNQGDTLIITEISRLGRSTSEVIQLINSLFEQKIRLCELRVKNQKSKDKPQ